jgi:hypothetical protein
VLGYSFWVQGKRGSQIFNDCRGRCDRAKLDTCEAKTSPSCDAHQTGHVLVGNLVITRASNRTVAFAAASGSLNGNSNSNSATDDSSVAYANNNDSSTADDSGNNNAAGAHYNASAHGSSAFHKNAENSDGADNVLCDVFRDCDCTNGRGASARRRPFEVRRKKVPGRWLQSCSISSFVHLLSE